MGLFDNFFGGPEAPDARDAWTQGQRAYLLNPLMASTYETMYGPNAPERPGAPLYDPGPLRQDPYMYQGQYAAGVSPLQQQYFGMAPQVAQQQLGHLGRIAGSQAPLDAMYQYGQRYADDVITPNVMERFAGLGTADSGGAMRGLARELGTYGLGLNSQIGQAGLQNQAQQMQAAGMMGQVPGMLGLAGGEQRNVNQQMIAGDIQRSQALHPLSSPAAQMSMNMLGLRSTPQPQPAGLGYSMLTGLAGSQGVGDAMGAGLSAVGGGLASGAGALLGLISDERAKEDIEEVSGVLSKLKNIKLRTYNYKGDDTKRMGLIAQEIEKEFPEAVFEKDGLKHVDLYALQSIIIAGLAEWGREARQLSEVA